MTHASCATIHGVFHDEPVESFMYETFKEFIDKKLILEDTSGSEEEVRQWIRDAKAEHTAFFNAVVDFLAERDHLRRPGQVAMRKIILEFINQ
jgi:hypothetical protein